MACQASLAVDRAWHRCAQLAFAATILVSIGLVPPASLAPQLYAASGLPVDARYASAAPLPLTTPNSITPRQSATKSGSPRSSTRTSSGGSWISTLGSLGFVVALILAGAFVLKRHGPGARGRLPNSVLQPLGRRQLDPRNSIQLVRCGSRILVLGSSVQGLTTLAEITDPVEVDYLAGLCQQADAEHAPVAFDQLLNRFRSDSTAAVTPEQPPARPAQASTVATDDSDVAMRRLKQRLHQSSATRAESVESHHFRTAVAGDSLPLEQAHG